MVNDTPLPTPLPPQKNSILSHVQLFTDKMNTDQNMNLFCCAPPTVQTVVLGSTGISRQLYTTCPQKPETGTCPKPD